MSANQTRLIIGVSDHWLIGTLPLDESRIQDRLNDSRSDFVKLIDVEIHDHQDRQCVATLPEVVVSKCRIKFAGTPSKEHEAPEKRLNRYANKDTFAASAVLGRYCVSGDLHLPEFSGDSLHTLSHQLGRFFPITDATMIGGKGKQICFPLLIANKDFVSCFYVGSNTEAGRTGVFANLSDLAASSSDEPASIVAG